MRARLALLPAAFCVLALGAAPPATAAPKQTNSKAHHNVKSAKTNQDADDRAPREKMLFASMDKNHDGVITRDEWRGSEKSFEAHDWNHDGVLSGDEVKPGAKRPAVATSGTSPKPAARAAAPAGGESDEVLFRRLDSNSDGRISRDEWVAAKKSPRQFDALDKNHDGFLSPLEFGVGR